MIPKICYDSYLICREVLDRSGLLHPGPIPSAVGISICLDKVVMLLHDSGEKVDSVDVVLWSSSNSTASDAAAIVKDVWGAGMKCLLLDSVSYFRKFPFDV